MSRASPALQNVGAVAGPVVLAVVVIGVFGTVLYYVFKALGDTLTDAAGSVADAVSPLDELEDLWDGLSGEVTMEGDAPPILPEWGIVYGPGDAASDLYDWWTEDGR